MDLWFGLNTTVRNDLQMFHIIHQLNRHTEKKSPIWLVSISHCPTMVDINIFRNLHSWNKPQPFTLKQPLPKLLSQFPLTFLFHFAAARGESTAKLLTLPTYFYLQGLSPGILSHARTAGLQHGNKTITYFLMFFPQFYWLSAMNNFSTSEVSNVMTVPHIHKLLRLTIFSQAAGPWNLFFSCTELQLFWSLNCLLVIWWTTV